MSNLESIKERISNVNPSYIELCSDFLILYSRFEYALKECGFLQTSTRVMASIEKYVSSIKDKFKLESGSKLEVAINFIIESPPKVFQIRNESLIWEEKKEDGETLEVLPEYLRRVRNNLLHGGKFYGGIETGSRNLNLISNSIIIIEYWIDLNEDVKSKFREF
ncbi:hypothetical protein [uncultured Algoriphagus sp.]|uniref:hypothetical protein n=1 Tax=uncultured Algoriphagus sp. TaxID=417365 RepID=UPI0030EF1E49|tara:strand:+ start:10969 stop:11460 length:492 start_codon:yes stop_codon:yes gene_type:complete